MFKKLIALILLAGILVSGAGAAFLYHLWQVLPNIIKVEDYKPLLVSEVYARGGEKIGEYFRENRIMVPAKKIPKQLINAFLAAEDDQFYQHSGINFFAILRAGVANFRAGRTVQGGSTITQQTAKAILSRKEKTLSRKLNEALFAIKMEQHLSKEDILYLYLNQIYFGGGAYGIGSAAETYFRKTVDQLTLAECAILAGLPKAPTDFSPMVNPVRAKERQRYVLSRMRDVGFINADEEKAAAVEPIKINIKKEYKSAAPYYVEAVRLLLNETLGQDKVLDEGLKIYTAVDFKAQVEAQLQVREGLRALDKRQGYRGALRRIEDPKDVQAFLLAGRKQLIDEKMTTRIIPADGKLPPDPPWALYQKKNDDGAVVSNLPSYVPKAKAVEAYVDKVDDRLGLVYVRFAETQALIDISDMTWARKPDPSINSDFAPRISKPSQAVKAGDVILVKVTDDRFSSSRLSSGSKKKGAALPAAGELPDFSQYAKVTLEQEPAVEAAMVSFDQNTEEILAMVGGYDFKRSEFNRAFQAARQTGSSFKPIIYASALDKDYTAATTIADAPIVFEERNSEAEDGQDEVKKWKPSNYEKKFEGDVLFRTALVRSLNIPTVKIMSDIGIEWGLDYSRRLGIFSPLNKDTTLALGSSGVTVYEMVKTFSQFGRGGKRIRPILIHKVLDHDGKQILGEVSLDKKFEKEIGELDRQFEERRKAYFEKLGESTADPNAVGGSADGANAANNSGKPPETIAAVQNGKPVKKTPDIFFKDPDQLLSPQTSYLITNLLTATIQDPNGTGARARALGRIAAGKTGTTSGYYDTWFMGFTPQIIAGVWVGYDDEKSLGVGEAGGRTALPIWLEYMKYVHQNLPDASFPVPSGIVFANIDAQTGKLASASSKNVIRQAFREGTEPTTLSNSSKTKDDADFLKEDLSE